MGLAMLSAAALAQPAVVQAQPTATQASANSVILHQLSFIKTGDLDFGDIVVGASGGTVRLYPNGTRTTTGSVSTVGTTQQPATFSGAGTVNQQVLISLSANSIQLTGPGAPMTVSNFEIGSSPSAILSTSPQRFRISSANGVFAFPVGATLTVNANQAPGSYAGTWQITLNYQ